MNKNAVDTALDDIISQSEAARLRGVSREAIRNLIDRGRLRGVTVGGRLCVYRSEVLSFEPDKGGRPSNSSKKNGSKKGTKK
jgi:excisionase family DNA binding protein